MGLEWQPDSQCKTAFPELYRMIDTTQGHMQFLAMMRVTSYIRFLSYTHGFNLRPSFYVQYAQQQRQRMAMIEEMANEDDEALFIDLRSEWSDQPDEMTIDLSSDEDLDVN